MSNFPFPGYNPEEAATWSAFPLSEKTAKGNFPPDLTHSSEAPVGSTGAEGLGEGETGGLAAPGAPMDAEGFKGLGEERQGAWGAPRSVTRGWVCENIDCVRESRGENWPELPDVERDAKPP